MKNNLWINGGKILKTTFENLEKYALGLAVLAFKPITWQAEQEDMFVSSLGFLTRPCLKSPRWSCLC